MVLDVGGGSDDDRVVEPLVSCAVDPFVSAGVVEPLVSCAVDPFVSAGGFGLSTIAGPVDADAGSGGDGFAFAFRLGSGAGPVSLFFASGIGSSVTAGMFCFICPCRGCCDRERERDFGGSDTALSSIIASSVTSCTGGCGCFAAWLGLPLVVGCLSAIV